MKIVVAIKPAAGRDEPLRIASSGKWIEEADLALEIAEADAYALEAGLQLKEKHGGEVIALCAGPPRAAQVIREALAKGADRAIHIEAEKLGFDPLATARLLAAVIAAETPDLVLAGLQSDDLGHGQTGVILAELLGLPHATIVMEVEVGNGSLRVKREMENGWFQNVEMPLPALIAVQSGIGKLRYATLMGIRKAKTKEVRRISAADLGGVAAASGAVVDRVYLPERTRRAQLFGGSPQEAAAMLVDKLKFEARAL